MIKANELRIGNYLIDREFPTLTTTVSKIICSGTIEASYDDGKNIEEFKPIPQTIMTCYRP